MKKIFLSCLYICALYSCAPSKGRLNDNIDTFSEFPQKDSVRFERLSDFTNGEVIELEVIDSILVLKTRNKGNDGYLYNYNVSSNRYSKDYLERGKGPSEVLSVFSMGKTNDGLWTYDYTKQRLSVIDFNGSEMEPELFTTQFYKVKSDRLHQVMYLGSNRLLGQIQDENYKSAIFDFKNDEKIGNINPFAAVPKIKPLCFSHAANHIYLSNPDSNRIVFAYLLTDVIEIFDLEGGCLYSATQGPDCFDIIHGNYEDNKGNMYMTPLEKTKCSYLEGYASDKYIYLLYSGENARSEKLSLGANSIFVYDWDGKPVRRLNLDRYIKCFGVTPDDDILYAYDGSNGHLIKAELDQLN